MQVTAKRCAGLDVHQATVVACVMIHGRRKQPTKEVRSFGTMTHELEALRDWLKAEGVTHVGMESTGVYWRPVHAVPPASSSAASPPMCLAFLAEPSSGH